MDQKRKIGLALLAVVVIFVMLRRKKSGAPCTADTQCVAPQKCQGGVCVDPTGAKKCPGDFQCDPATQTCVGGVCVSKAPPKPLVSFGVGSWKNQKTSDWWAKQTPIFSDSTSYEDCHARCAANPECKTMTGYITYPDAPKRPCQHFGEAAPLNAIQRPAPGSTWEGQVSARV